MPLEVDGRLGVDLAVGVGDRDRTPFRVWSSGSARPRLATLCLPHVLEGSTEDGVTEFGRRPSMPRCGGTTIPVSDENGARVTVAHRCCDRLVLCHWGMPGETGIPGIRVPLPVPVIGRKRSLRARFRAAPGGLDPLRHRQFPTGGFATSRRRSSGRLAKGESGLLRRRIPSGDILLRWQVGRRISRCGERFSAPVPQAEAKAGSFGEAAEPKGREMHDPAAMCALGRSTAAESGFGNRLASPFSFCGRMPMLCRGCLASAHAGGWIFGPLLDRGDPTFKPMDVGG